MIGRLLLGLCTAAISLLLVIALCLALLRSVPGGPFDQERMAPVEIQAALAAHYRLNEPFHVQLFDYVDRLIHGDFGPSFQQADFSVNQLIESALPLTLGLGAVALAVAMLLAICSASISMPATGLIGRAFSAVSTLLLATPKFVLGPLLVLWLALAWRWLPVTAYGQGYAGWVLPVLTLALPQWAWLHRLCASELGNMRSGVLWRAQRARGDGRGSLWVNLSWPLLLPRLTLAILPVAIALLSGSAVVEQVFSIPGMGRLLIQGALNRDHTLVLGVVTVTAALVLMLGLLADLISRWLDPRLRRA